MQQFDRELVSGSVRRSVWKLTWPFVGAQVARGLNVLVAQSLVGHYVGKEGLAAFGVAMMLFFLSITLFIALLQGMAIHIARYTGRQDSDALSRLVYETFKATFLILVFFLLPLGYFMAPQALVWMNTAPEVREHALPFLRTVLLGGAPLMLLLLVNRAFQASGDVRTPLVLGIISTVCNVSVSVVLITVFDLGVLGAAWGFIVGPVPSLCIALALIYHGKMVIRPPKRYTLRLDLDVLKSVTRIGLPTGIMSLLMTLVGVIIMSMLGSLKESVTAQAAYTVGYIQLFSFFNWVGFSLSAASNTLIGQNIGAGDPARGKRCVLTAALGGALWAIALGFVFWFYPARLLSISDMAEGPVLEMGIGMLRFLAFAGFFTVIAQTCFGGLMGAGDTKSPMFIIIIAQIGVLLGYCALVNHFSVLTATTVWTAILAAAVVRFLLAGTVFLRGRWRHIKVELDGLEAVDPAEGGALGG